MVRPYFSLAERELHHRCSSPFSSIGIIPWIGAETILDTSLSLLIILNVASASVSYAQLLIRCIVFAHRNGGALNSASLWCQSTVKDKPPSPLKLPLHLFSL